MGFKSTGTLKTGGAFWMQCLIRTALNETTYNSSFNVYKRSKTAGCKRLSSPNPQVVCSSPNQKCWVHCFQILPWPGSLGGIFHYKNIRVSSLPLSPSPHPRSSFSLSFLKWIFIYCKPPKYQAWSNVLGIQQWSCLGSWAECLAPSLELSFTNTMMQICLSDCFSP